MAKKSPVLSKPAPGIASARTAKAAILASLADAPVFITLRSSPATLQTTLMAVIARELSERGIALTGNEPAPSQNTLASKVAGYFTIISSPSGVRYAYIWDIFDNNGIRIQRLSGEELASSAADHRALQKIARTSAIELARFFRPHNLTSTNL